ncbi:hypothetical protein C7271_12735, partial [filamentous cyanobacterium CCP5]
GRHALRVEFDVERRQVEADRLDDFDFAAPVAVARHDVDVAARTLAAAAFAAANAAIVIRQSDLTAAKLQDKVLSLLNSPGRLQEMGIAAGQQAIADSADQLADLIHKVITAEV